MIESLDQSLFYVINGLEFGWFDKVLIACREKETWIPLYLFMLIFAYIKMHWRRATLFVLLSLSCVLVGDQLSSNLIKKNIKRARPCHLESGLQHIDLRVHCGGGYSFTSSHATNHTALGVFWFLALFPFNRKWRWALIAWALLVGFCQIFVGVHYPFDVLAGSILGALIGISLFQVFRFTKFGIQDPS